MAQYFSTSGTNYDYGATSPNLYGSFLTSIDQEGIVDGFRVVAPLGGGGTSRQSITSSVSTEATDASTIDTALSGSLVSYDLSDYDVDTVSTPDIYDFSVDIPEAIEYEITTPSSTTPYEYDPVTEDLSQWSSENTIMYSSGLSYFWDHSWELLDIASITSWNDLSADGDGSFVLAGADTGVYVSTSSGDSWSLKTPGTQGITKASTATSGGKAVIVGDSDYAAGTIWVTSDSGTNWSDITVAL